MDRYKVNRIVEFIKSYGKFPFDSGDVMEGLTDVLNSYGIYSALRPDEYYLLIDELLEISENAEIAEAVKWAEWQLECGQDVRLACDYRIPGFI